MKEIKKRTKTMNSLPTEKAAEKIVYLRAIDDNERWAQRKLRGFSTAKPELQEMFRTRYGITREEGWLEIFSLKGPRAP